MNSISSISSSALRAYAASQQVTAVNIANMNTESVTAKTLFHENRYGGVNTSISTVRDTVDISSEAANLLTNTLGFKANLAVLKKSDEATQNLLSIMA